jgi:hypothetical protein
MEENKNTLENAPTKLTYEQLENAANQLAQQNHMLRNQLAEMNYANLFKRLDYLFKVLKYAHAFPVEFVEASKNEIVSLMTPEETAETTETEQQKD